MPETPTSAANARLHRCARVTSPVRRARAHGVLSVTPRAALHPALGLLPGLLLLALFSACSSNPAPSDASDASTDGAPVDGDPADGPSDAPPPDVMWPACTVPSLQIANTPETMPLAMAPARCGQASHRWLTDPSLGTVTARGATGTFSANTLRTLAAAVFSGASTIVRSDVQFDQIAYTTQDRGRLTTATMLVARPVSRTMAATLDIILLLHGTSGFNDRCAPSNESLSRTLAALLASAGYVVVAPDYLGLRGFGDPSPSLHPYLVGQPTAIASLDAVRATWRFLEAQHSSVCASSRVLTLGGSQGGHAALWVDRLQPYYAREITHVGVVATVPPADVTEEIQRAMQSIVPATANSAAVFATMAPWYGLEGRIGEVFRMPYDAQIPMGVASSCGLSGARVGVLTEVFQPAALAAAMTPDTLRAWMQWGCMLRENSLTTTSIARRDPAYPAYGVLYVLAQSDDLVNPDIERRSFQTLCSQGMYLQYLECEGAGHIQGTQWSLPEIFDFARDRFAGVMPNASAACMVRPATRCRGTQ